jgi:hypothetical protein
MPPPGRIVVIMSFDAKPFMAELNSGVPCPYAAAIFFIESVGIE